MTRSLLVVIDIQNEYVTPGRPFFLAGIGPSLARAKEVLQHARQQGWEVIHVQHLQAAGSIFEAGSELSAIVEEFKPLGDEKLVIKSDFSSYSSETYRELLARVENREIYLMGYGSTMCCLSTIVDGHHRGHRYRFVANASWSKSSQRFSESSMHEHAVEILGPFCEIVEAEDLTTF